jgi:crotonobetainyl-CoA:carnitine CoA-transferase CaiB-like acyl-CoA transferase
MSTGPLAGVVVVDLSRALPGPHVTMMLGDLGPQVIKVESPGHGDDIRGGGPPFVAPLRFFDADRGEQTRTAHRPPPTLGADNQRVLTWLSEHVDRH